MNSLLGIFKKSKKGDSFRPTEPPFKYNDNIAALNSLGDNQYEKLNTQAINRISKTTAAITPRTSSGNTILPGRSK